MDIPKMWEPALNPEDLARFFVARANAGDFDRLAEWRHCTYLVAARKWHSDGGSGPAAAGRKLAVDD
jgi:hypothetical protein